MKHNKQNKSLGEIIVASDTLLSLIVVALGFLVGTVLILIIGKNPAGMYKAILQVLTGYNIDRGRFYIRYIGEWLCQSMPFILCGFAMGFAARAGLFNIGGEGQYIVGLTVAQFIAFYFPQISVLHWLAALLFAAFAGGLWGAIVGWLKAKYEVSEVVATIMLNYIALYSSRILVSLIPGTNTYRTPNFPASVLLKTAFLEKLTGGSRLNIGIVFVILSTLVYWFIMEKTSVGFGLRATGFNKEAARASGISVVKSIVLSMFIAGVFAGLAGAIVALGSFRYGRVIASMDGYGFAGIAVALVGNNRAGGTLLAGLLFGMLSSAQPLMESNSIPKEITYIIQGLVVVFIALRAGFGIIVRNSLKKKLQKEIQHA
ncbi:ABC transporter permease [Treponema phagedenis]|uniref:ABC transporter permease n=1 Tax=Treponema phagedenis TaxID=162 RepID=A0AAE6ITF4_TREPH|nr:ABC transporter permease [Treponema phagedenis]QEJ97585.1 ABC transporter permease [Treponema phagedenis]QEK00552.1 ABC transporter permease [Treponema phagedenis]QEK05560.1 ABC transporter permease [Treponema phagedenis]TYT79388.1 ABC transporter permease [Treponema phagedenis]